MYWTTVGRWQHRDGDAAATVDNASSVSTTARGKPAPVREDLRSWGRKLERSTVLIASALLNVTLGELWSKRDVLVEEVELADPRFRQRSLDQ